MPSRVFARLPTSTCSLPSRTTTRRSRCPAPIALAWDAFALDSTPEVVRWARGLECSEFEQRALLAYVSSDRSYARQAVAGVQAVRGVRAKARYASALLVPNRTYVRIREGSYR